MEELNQNPNEKQSVAQTELIYTALKAGRRITALDALHSFNCFRLSARIKDLKKKFGEDLIKTEIIKLENGKRVAQYFIQATAMLLVLITVACSKTEIVEPMQQHAPGQPAPANRYTLAGKYEGENTYNIPGLVHQTIFTPRNIYYTGDSIIVKWFTHPDTFAVAQYTDSLRYTITSRQRNSTCGDQMTEFIWQSTGYVRHDTLFEKGNVVYNFYYNGTLRKHLTGTWQSWAKKL